MATTTPSARDDRRHVQLEIGGMTCASCAMRIEKKLNRLDGVTASVNYATEKATVDCPPEVTPKELVAVVEATGYTAHVAERGGNHEHGAGHEHDHDVPHLGRRVAVSALLALPVVALAMVSPLQFDGWQWVSLALAIPVVTWGGWPFHRATWLNLRHRAATMDTLISIGTLAAFGWSVYAMVFGDAGALDMRHPFELRPQRGMGASQIYLEVAAGVTVFILLGRWIEARAKRRSGAALRALLDLGAKDVSVLREGNEVRVPIGELAVGDEFVVRPGEKIATDGVIIDGSSAIDASLVTGEPVPQEVGPGDAVIGATLNAGGRLVVRATRVGAETALAQIARLVEEAQAGKADVQRLADRIAGIFVPAVIALAAVTLGAWLLFTDATTADAFTAAVTVLIIACPCALGLATPTALMVGTGRAAQLGIVIRGPEVLESTRAVDTIVLDKTGTVTTGAMQVVDIAAGAADEDLVLRLAASLEDASEHPIGRAIVLAATTRGVDLAAVTGFVNNGGLGVEGDVDGHRVAVGRERFLAERGIPFDAALVAVRDHAESLGHTPVFVGWDAAMRGVIVVADTVKPTSASAVSEMRALGLRPVLLTGDNERAARAVAAEVGIADVIAEVLPADKADVVARLQREGRVVAMVGDGVNDAAALATADLGIAIGTGTDVAIEASDLTLVRGDLRVVGDAIRLARRTLAIIKGNLFWAFAYNVAALPLAAFGALNPMLAGLAMAGSSVFVVMNSLRLRGFRSGVED